MSAIDMATLGVFAWALALNILGGIISFLEDLEESGRAAEQAAIPPNVEEWRDVRGRVLGIFRPFYTVIRIQESESSSARIRVSPWMKFPLMKGDMIVLRSLFRRVSLLSLAIIGIIRFSVGEPILNIF